uniref:RING-type domain-containing protein n=1 Tax=Cyanistes caeruleus TaxID=156563 RepID=A0A8C0UGR7_CYACU
PAECLLCRRVEADPDICGDKQEKYGLCAHVFCLVSAAPSCALPGALGLCGEAPRLPLMGLLGSFQHCCVCGQSGATILCCKEGCDRWFHLPCAKEGGCVTQAYCPEHRPKQDVQVTPEPGTECPICMEPVEDRKTFNTIVCPACKRAWFHRDCLQVGQHSSFCCPLCRDRETFLVEVFFLGIRTPIRGVSWEAAPGALQGTCVSGRAQSRRSQWCWAAQSRAGTLCLQSHQPVCFRRPWKLLLCSSCAAEGTHRRCSGLTVRTTHWECDSCAGLGT